MKRKDLEKNLKMLASFWQDTAEDMMFSKGAKMKSNYQDMQR